jgi:hypothetical protein
MEARTVFSWEGVNFCSFIPFSKREDFSPFKEEEAETEGDLVAAMAERATPVPIPPAARAARALKSAIRRVRFLTFLFLN